MTRTILALLLAGCVADLMGEPSPPATSSPLSATLQPVFGHVAGPCDVRSAEPYGNFRLILHYDAAEGAQPELMMRNDFELSLPPGKGREVEIAYEQVEARLARVRVWHEGKQAGEPRDVPGSARSGAAPFLAERQASRRTFRLDRNCTVMVRFADAERGTLVAKAPAKEKWAPDAKALFLRGGKIVFDIGWLGDLVGDTQVADGKEHVAVLTRDGASVRLHLDGGLEFEHGEFNRPDRADHVFKIGSAAPDFGGDFEGTLLSVRFWKRALSGEEARQLSSGNVSGANTADWHWRPPPETSEDHDTPALTTRLRLVAGPGFELHRAVVQPLERSDHGAIVRAWGAESFSRGKTIYHQLCVTCHGTPEKPGSLPTALRFHEGELRNGIDPYRLFQTLEEGYGMMVGQPQYTTRQKYDVIHYLRESFLREHNPTQYFETDEEYLSNLPRGMSLETESERTAQVPQYRLQDFGNVLFWTLEVEKGNIAQKGIALRVDPGPGGVSKGKAWMLYDHDTMRLAACWTGEEFVDWKGIAFDGSHGTHTSIVGTRSYTFPNEPQWAHPTTGDFRDLRIRGRDGEPYGPLPADWVKFRALSLSGPRARLEYTVGERLIRETPLLNEEGEFQRILDVSASDSPSTLRLDDERTHKIPRSDRPLRVAITYPEGAVRVTPLPGSAAEPAGKTRARRFPGTVFTEIERGEEETVPFAIDVLSPPAPDRNPWQSWMRTTGFDFLADGRSAAVCTWNGDVWIVDGIDRSEGTLAWQRICAGLFQPLGLKVVDGEIYVGCRDMIAHLRDTNGDRETDVIEVFNNDHQVTEHFHEFAMGLQTDAEGNFYYAKSARHALPAVVPQHGTLLRVSNDGERTDILATGFRAANGVCLNPDGSFVVTDQEGHWIPKNRINWVPGEGTSDFYGNMNGYHSITDTSDEAMNPPLCWITNGFDRSPSELLWVPEDAAWTSLRGSLLNLSYGYGRIYVVPHEEVNGRKQGGICALPLERFPTGIMRGRFHPANRQLYACGMFAWAGGQRQPGGFYRVRSTGKPSHLPVRLEAASKRLAVTFTDPLDEDSARDPGNWTIEAWDLKRTRNYGSKHYDERFWKVERAELSPDGRTVTLAIPELAPTWCLSVFGELRGAGGERFEREIHGTIHALAE